MQIDATKDVSITGDKVSIQGAINRSAVTGTSSQRTRGIEPGQILWHDPSTGINAKKTTGTRIEDSILSRTTLSGANVSVIANDADLGARDSVEELAGQPGMAWVSQLQNDPKLSGKVDWVKVEEAHKNWNYDQQGLTPWGAAIVTAVMTYLTWGAASGVGATARQCGSSGRE